MLPSPLWKSCVLAFVLASLAVAGPSTTLATFSNTTINAAQVDASGNIYVAGYTSSATGGFGTPSSNHAFAAKLNPNGLTAYYVSLQGSGTESASAIAVDTTGAAYVYGQTNSVDFPVTAGALQTTLVVGGCGFVVKLDPQGKVVYSTFLGDSSRINPSAMLLDSVGNLFLSGVSTGAFPSTTPITTSNQAADFVVKLNATGTAIIGAIRGVGGLLAADGQGNIYTAGIDEGQGVTITPGAFQSKYTLEICGGDAQVGIGCSHQYASKLNSNLTQIVYSTYVTGTYGASPAAISVDAQGDVILVGTTNSSDYPTTPGAFEPTYLANAPPPPQTCLFTCFFPPPASGFVTELNPTGTGLVYSTFFSGSQADSISFAAFTTNGIYVAGQAGSADLPGLKGFAQPCLPATFETLLNPSATSLARAGATRILPEALPGRVLAFDPTTTTLIAWTSSAPISSLIRFDPSAPVTPISCILDAADLKPVTSIAPGELLTIFGPNLVNDSATPAPGTTSALGASVAFNTSAGPLLYVSPQQINVQAPYEISGTPQVNVALTSSAGGGDSRTLGVVASNPVTFLDTVTQLTKLPAACQVGIELAQSAIPLAFNADGSRNTCANPAKAGSTITLYLAGLGDTSLAAVTGGVTQGPPVALNLPVTASGSVSVVSVTSTVGWISGVWQVNLATSAKFTGLYNFALTVASVPVRDFTLLVWVD